MTTMHPTRITKNVDKVIFGHKAAKIARQVTIQVKLVLKVNTIEVH